MAPQWFNLYKVTGTRSVDLTLRLGPTMNPTNIVDQVDAASSSNPPATDQVANSSQASSFPMVSMETNTFGHYYLNHMMMETFGAGNGSGSSSSTLTDLNSSAGAEAASRSEFVGPDLDQLSEALNNNAAPKPNSPPTEPPVPEGYIVMKVPAGRKARNQRFGVNPGGGVMKPEGQQTYKYHDPNRRCTNFNCQIIDTPMWRPGPKGPMTLCNACGLKYRKMTKEEKRQLESDGAN